MSKFAAILARWRVRLGYILAIAVLWLARPTPKSIAIGAALGICGLWLRALAAGYLHKQEVLTISGPYAYTRNPLYFGSFILSIGAAVATRSWASAAILMTYFVLVYSVVMRREEEELRAQHSVAFEAYARAVPLFFPRLTPAKLDSQAGGKFSFSQYRKNHEYQAALGFLLLLLVLTAIWWFRSH
jgi:protein-S-isoprenylcysteine O-methyltransferase Ste14